MIQSAITRLYKLRVDQYSEEEQEKIIFEFVQCGWIYIGRTCVTHENLFFVDFYWDKPLSPVFPQGFEPH